MNDRDPDFLYQLIPEYLRFSDAAEGEPLRALFRALDGEYQRLAHNMDSLYDDWFIETCADWVVPYIAELVGVRGLDRPGGFRRSDRALVGNAIRNRRRKGVPTALGDTASEATGWPTLAVAAIPRLATTQAMAHPEPRRRTTVSLRDAAALALLGTPFDVLAHTASVTGGRERWNLPGVALFRWRLESYPVERAAAREVGPGAYTFHPFGIDSPLFNPPGTGTSAGPAPSPAAFPGPLTRRQLQADAAVGRTPPFEIFVRLEGEAEAIAVPAAHVVPADLSAWRHPDAPSAPASPLRRPPVRVAVDPELGRLALASGQEAAEVRATYCYGFAADLGGGPYARAERPADRPSSAAPLWQAEVAASFPSQPVPPKAGEPLRFSTVDAALAAWPAEMDGAIRILDSSTYEVSQKIQLGARAAAPARLSVAAAQGARPCLVGDLQVSGPPPAPARVHGAAELELSGLWIDGGVVLSGAVNLLRILNTTLRPPAGKGVPAPSVRVEGEPPSALEVRIARSVVGPLRLPRSLLGLEIADSIVDAGSGGAGAAIYGEGPEPSGPSVRLLARATIFGEAHLQQLLAAQDVLFTAPVRVARPDQGEVRFSYLPAGSQTPRRVHCLTDDGGALRPVFTAVAYGAPGYAQLDALTPARLRTGSERGGEIGVFESLDQAGREAALRGAIEEYLRWGMSQEIIDVT